MKFTKPKVIIIGTGGLAKEFVDFFKNQIEIVGFSTKKFDDFEKSELNGELFPSDLSCVDVPTNNLILAIGSPKLKRKLFTSLKNKGFKFPSLIHETSIISTSAHLDEGVIVSPMCIIGPKVEIHKCVYINYQVGIGHDADIGSYTQINPGVQVGGFSVIEGDSLIGSNSTILDKTFIARNINIGSASVVIGRKTKKGTIAPSYSKYLQF